MSYSYIRVIPRDFFNEADLLKCYGKLWICLDELRGHQCQLGNTPNDSDPGDHSGDPFVISQNEMDGSLTVANIPFFIQGERWYLSRPLNCRSPWPLWCTSGDEEICECVFTEEGQLSIEFVRLIKGD